MKRSEINGIIRQFEDMLARHCFALPPFTGFTPEQWAEALSLIHILPRRTECLIMKHSGEGARCKTWW